MRKDLEYQLCKSISTYIKLQYPKILFRFDYAGLNLSKAQAGRMKAIQGDRGFPDLTILEPNEQYNALFIELKTEDVLRLDLTKKSNEHIKEQYNYLKRLESKGYYACFAHTFDLAKEIIDKYMINR